MFSAILFDLDGLLIDSERVALDVWSQVASEHKVKTPANLWPSLIGKRTQDVLIELSKHVSTQTSLRLNESFDRCYQSLLQGKQVPPKKGALELTNFLNKNEIPWGIATGSHRQDALLALSSIGLQINENLLVCGDEVCHGKPHPEIFLKLAERLNVVPQNCIALEDSTPGIKAALSAKMNAIWIPDCVTIPVVYQRKLQGIFESLEILLSSIQLKNEKILF